jgi:deoxycytidylate deaminase
LVDLVDRLNADGNLSQELTAKGDSFAICRHLLTETSIKDSKVMDLLEFGRDIHAEMSAISDAARLGIALGAGTLYTTTFPCHLCAKHNVACGIRRVVYIEPYPKSYASELHSDAIEVECNSDGKKVDFSPFIGISPFRYRELFEKGRRKYGGLAQQWNKGEKRPMIEVYYPTYFKAEAHVVGLISAKLAALSSANPQTDVSLPPGDSQPR